MNFLHYGRRPTCFGHLLWPSSGSCFPKDILQRTSNTSNNFWDLLICRNAQRLDTDIYKKPISTDKINFSSSHPKERKLEAYRYLTNRMHTWPLNENKHEEWNNNLHIAKTKGFSYSIIWKLNTQVTQKLILPPSHNNTTFNPKKKRITVTYYNPKIRKIANLFQSTNIRITFSTNNTIYDIFKVRTNNINTCMTSGIYQLQCQTCHPSCIDQIGRHLQQRYKERIRYINSNNRQSAYALQNLHNQHDYGPMNVTVSLLHPDNKHRRLNSLENFYVWLFQRHNAIINE